MTIEQALYWASYAIPFVLILVGASARKLVKKGAWHWKHFYCGIDLTLAVLGSALVNILDLAKVQSADKRAEGLAWTSLFIAACVALLFSLSGLHQDWESEDRYGKGQIFLLGIMSNGVGIALGFAFVQLKMRGLL